MRSAISEYGRDLILPTKDKQENGTTKVPPKPSGETVSTAMKKTDPAINTSAQAKPANVKTSTTKISLKENFVCSPKDLYDVFVNEQVSLI